MPTTHHVSPVEMERALEGVDYPTDKQSLVEKARENGASQDVIGALEDLPESEYGGPQDVMRAYGTEDEEEDAE